MERRRFLSARRGRTVRRYVHSTSGIPGPRSLIRIFHSVRPARCRNTDPRCGSPPVRFPAGRGTGQMADRQQQRSRDVLSSQNAKKRKRQYTSDDSSGYRLLRRNHRMPENSRLRCPYTHADGHAQRVVFADPILCLGAFRGNKEKMAEGPEPMVRKSVFPVPEGPGLGLDLNQDWLRAHIAKGDT